jgi:hypothetical protein
MTTQNRTPAGIPTGGQYANHDRAEGQAALAHPPRIQLDGALSLTVIAYNADTLPPYPAHLAEPVISYTYGDDNPGTIYVSFDIDGVHVSVWQDDGYAGGMYNSIHDSDEETGYDEDTDEELLTWAHAVRDSIENIQYSLTYAAVEQFQDDVIRAALGKTGTPNTPTPLPPSFVYDDTDIAALTSRNADLGHRMLAAAGMIDQGDDPESAIETGIRDALTNLRHLAARHNFDFDDIEEYSRRTADGEQGL